jgi:8-oxo-dGTP pyrophosphatase MutT (NUDIX family)
MRDIIFKTDDYVFSYRVAGLLVHNNKILLQRLINDTAYALPGGHVELGETNEETLIREFKEEINANVRVVSLQWVGEIFFPWPSGNKPCHQICLYYKIELTDDKCIPLQGAFLGIEQLEDGSFKLEFSWVDIDRISDIELYPVDAKNLLAQGFQGVKHFVYKE